MTASPRAVVADDSHFMRTVISDILEAGGVEVVAEAKDGEEAVEAVGTHEPDVVTMDVEMPVMNGIEAVERIVALHPTPVVMLSAHTDGNADVTFEALDAGAVDFFTKPGGEVSMEMPRLEDQLVEIVRSVARASVDDCGTVGGGPVGGGTVGSGPDGGDGRRTGATGGTVDLPGSAGRASESSTYADDPTLVIGSSTGGPKTVEGLLSTLPVGADFRVLAVQHMPEGFTERFAARIDSRSEYDVREATDGDHIGGGEALVAAGNRHMIVTDERDSRLRVALEDSPPVNSVRPSVDVTMESAAAAVDGPLVGVVLTGMGGDGAAGIEAIKAAGGQTFAQDEATSAVYGMPRRAVETGCVDAELPIDDVPAAVLDAIRREVT